jgi:hypothetical protein
MQWRDDLGWDHIEVCQSFLVGGNTDWNVDRITLKAREFGTSVADQGFYLQLWTVGDAHDYTGNSLISTQSGTFPGSGLGTGYWTFAFDHVNLPHGQYYAFLLGFDSGPDPQRFVNFIHAYSAYDLYPEGRMFCRMGTPAAWSTMTHLGDRDFDFYVQGIPEPGTLALIAPALLGFAGIAFRRMRRS